MKIRIQGSSIRFRLKQFEVQDFKEKGIVQERIAFGDATEDQLHFILRATDEQNLSIEQHGTTIQLNVPKELKEDWTNTDRVGFEERLITTKGKQITVLVEKDFKCLDRSDEEEVGSYPNPMKQF
jgi:hypothetical protein